VVSDVYPCAKRTRTTVGSRDCGRTISPCTRSAPPPACRPNRWRQRPKARAASEEERKRKKRNEGDRVRVGGGSCKIVDGRFYATTTTINHNTLAMRKVLQTSGMKLDTKCCLCGRLDEYGGHLLFGCKLVKR
jgi:hypothetical protein